MFPPGEFDAISKPLQSSFRQKMIKHHYSDTRLNDFETDGGHEIRKMAAKRIYIFVGVV